MPAIADSISKDLEVLRDILFSNRELRLCEGSSSAAEPLRNVAAALLKTYIVSGLLLHNLCDLNELIQSHVLLDLNTSLFGCRLVVEQAGSGNAGRNAVIAISNLAHCYDVVRNVGNIESAALNVGSQIEKLTGTYILINVGVIHLDNIRKSISCRIRCKLLPVVIPLVELAFHLNIGIQLVVLVQSLLGSLVANLIAPPCHHQLLAAGAACILCCSFRAACCGFGAACCILCRGIASGVSAAACQHRCTHGACEHCRNDLLIHFHPPVCKSKTHQYIFHSAGLIEICFPDLHRA